MRLQVFHDLKQIAPSESAVAMGTFDGVHLGHQRVISCMTSTVHKLVPTVFTFDASPQEMFKDDGNLRLTANKSRLWIFGRLGIRRVYIPHSEEVRALSPREFVENILHGVIHVKEIGCGLSFHFGRDDKTGSTELKELCTKFDIEVVVVPALILNGKPVSSTHVREAPQTGNITEITRFLDRFCPVDFPVTHGRQLKCELGTPTTD